MSLLLLLLGVSFSVWCSCKGENNETSILISCDSAPHLIVLDMEPGAKEINHELHYNFVMKNTKITSLAVDYRRKQVFLMKISLGHIQVLEDFDSTTMNSQNKSLHHGISKTHAEVAVDWITGNVYWVDAWMNWIMMQPSKTNYTSSMYLPIVYKHLDHPCSLTLDPIAGYLFWGDCGEVPVIERSTLAGKDRVILVNQSIASPISMKADNSGYLFWVDRVRSSVETMSYSGQNRSVLIRFPDSDLTCLTIYKNMVIVVDHFNNKIMGLDKHRGEQTFALSFNKLNSHLRPWAVEVYSKETQPISRDPCNLSNRCEHMCVRTITGGAQCLCQMGYTLMSDQQNCHKTGDRFEMEIVLTDQRKICGFDIQHISSPFFINSPHCPFSSTANISHMAIDTRLSLLYVSYLNMIDELALNENQSVVLLEDLQEKIGDLKYDWVDRNLVFTQPKSGMILALSLDSRRLVEVLSNRVLPSYITLDVHRRYMYWIEKRNSIWSIYKADIDGKNINQLQLDTNLTNPGHLAFYVPDNFLFFIDDGDIKSVHLNEKKEDTYYVQSINKMIHQHARSLTVWKDYLLWIEPGNNATHVVSMSIKTLQIVSNNKFSYDFQEILIIDRTTQLNEPYPCADSNCEHMCLTSTTTGQCACAFGYSVSNRTDCVSDVKENGNYILVADTINHEIYQIDMANSEDVQALKQFSRINALEVTYDGTKKQVYIVDKKQLIYDAPLLSEFKASGTHFINKDLFFPRNLVVDEINGNMYFSMYISTLERYYILVMKGKKTKFLIASDGNAVNGMAVSFGLIFWTNTTAVYSAYGDGSNAKSIVKPLPRSFPKQITIDKKNKRIYWIENTHTGQSFIRSAQLDGSNSKTYTNTTETDIVGINIYEDFLYYTTTKTLAIMKMSLENGSRSEFSKHLEFGQLGSFVIHTNKSPSESMDHPCSINNGGCDTFCLPKGDHPDQYICACDINSQVVGQKSCDGTCTDFIQNGVFTEDCSFKKGDNCTFLCDYGLDLSYKPSLSTAVVTCDDDDEWNFPLDRLCIVESFPVCSTNVSNGYFDRPCNISDGGKCSFTCSPGFSSQLTNITCISGQWDNDIEKLCQISDIPTGGMSVGFVAAVVAGVVFLVIAAVIGFFLWQKLRMKKDDMTVMFVKKDEQQARY